MDQIRRGEVAFLIDCAELRLIPLGIQGQLFRAANVLSSAEVNATRIAAEIHLELLRVTDNPPTQGELLEYIRELANAKIS